MITQNPFVFCDYPSNLITEQDFCINIPAGINSNSELFDVYASEGKFPDYFGRNWNALYDCLADFTWINQLRIVICHADLPLASNQSELAIYLDILKSAVEGWIKMGIPSGQPGYPELVVYFPAVLENQVSEILKL